jgi:putative PIN family toxin of toxin-antitoxin system
VRVVLDTNVLVSGLMYPRSVPGRIVGAWRESRFDLVLSLEQLAEIGRVLAYRKIRKVLRWDDETIGRLLKQLFLRAEIIEADESVTKALRDPTDAPILSSFIAGRADYLVTGDADLLALRKRYKILAPSEFAKKLR